LGSKYNPATIIYQEHALLKLLSALGVLAKTTSAGVIEHISLVTIYSDFKCAVPMSASNQKYDSVASEYLPTLWGRVLRRVLICRDANVWFLPFFLMSEIREM
jgi:hypothetical protein